LRRCAMTAGAGSTATLRAIGLLVLLPEQHPGLVPFHNDIFSFSPI